MKPPALQYFFTVFSACSVGLVACSPNWSETGIASKKELFPAAGPIEQVLQPGYIDQAAIMATAVTCGENEAYRAWESSTTETDEEQHFVALRARIATKSYLCLRILRAVDDALNVLMRAHADMLPHLNASIHDPSTKIGSAVADTQSILSAFNAVVEREDSGTLRTFSQLWLAKSYVEAFNRLLSSHRQLKCNQPLSWLDDYLPQRSPSVAFAIKDLSLDAESKLQTYREKYNAFLKGMKEAVGPRKGDLINCIPANELETTLKDPTQRVYAVMNDKAFWSVFRVSSAPFRGFLGLPTEAYRFADAEAGQRMPFSREPEETVVMFASFCSRGNGAGKFALQRLFASINRNDSLTLFGGQHTWPLYARYVPHYRFFQSSSTGAPDSRKSTGDLTFFYPAGITQLRLPSE